MYVSRITKRVLEASICASSLISSDPSVSALSSVGKSGHTLTLHRVDVPAHNLIPTLTRLPVLKSVDPAISLSAWLILTAECTCVSRQNSYYHVMKPCPDYTKYICAPTTLVEISLKSR